VTAARRWRRLTLAAAAAAVASGAGILAPSGLATQLPQRTFPVTPPNVGPSTGAAISTDGGSIVFDAAGNVYLSGILTGASRLISASPGGTPGNGSSSAPVVSADGGVVAFVSTASNLAPGDFNGGADVFARAGAGTVENLSLAVGGGPADGASSEPAISADGRLVVFASKADDLVPGDHNGVSDVFLRDRQAGTTVRVSVARGGGEANGPSTTPAISADGRVITFASTATNLMAPDRNGVGDVFVRVPSTDLTERVSVSSSGQAQNAAVAAPFTQISSVSSDGRLVAFDSNATNLVTGEDPRPRTNVFIRDRRRHSTKLISQDNAGFEGNNDSFAPFISPTGLYVTFDSFARNLAPGGGPRANVFVRDLNLKTTSTVNVAPNGSAPGPELGRDPLARPSVSGDGTLATFISSAANLTGNRSGVPGVFLRLLTPPRGVLQGRPPSRGPARGLRVTVGADDPAATIFECRIDRALPFACPRGRLRLPALSVGTHVLLVRAGGPGLLYDPLGIRVTLHVTSRG
jgi:Tol biopolymer transport system component